jgi:hypothetical protein
MDRSAYETLQVGRGIPDLRDSAGWADNLHMQRNNLKVTPSWLHASGFRMAVTVGGLVGTIFALGAPRKW